MVKLHVTCEEEDEDRSSRGDVAKAALLGMVSLSYPSNLFS